MVLTQTLHLIYDRCAVDADAPRVEAWASSSSPCPGSARSTAGVGRTVVLVPHRPVGARLFGERFGAENVSVSVFGNVYAATASSTAWR
jgi:hypothetical protein